MMELLEIFQDHLSKGSHRRIDKDGGNTNKISAHSNFSYSNNVDIDALYILLIPEGTSGLLGFYFEIYFVTSFIKKITVVTRNLPRISWLLYINLSTSECFRIYS